jgi:hypothetical protein
MTKRVVTVALALGILLGDVTRAHEGGTDARGVVRSITPEEIVVTTTSGAELKAHLVATTEFVRGKESIRAGDIRPGERVVVHAAEHGGRLEAKLVKVAEGKKP